MGIGTQNSTIERSDGDSRNDQRDNDDDEPRLARKIPFRGFTDGSQEDIELLSAIEQYTPYDAQYGKKQEAWSNVVSHLKTLDKDRMAKGHPPRYMSLCEGACRKRWCTHQQLVHQYETMLKTGSGISPPPSAHMERMRRVVAAGDASKERVDRLKSQRNKSQEERVQRHSKAEEMRRLAIRPYGKRLHTTLDRMESQGGSLNQPRLVASSSSSSPSSSSSSSSFPTIAASSFRSNASASSGGAPSGSSTAPTRSSATAVTSHTPSTTTIPNLDGVYEDRLQRLGADSDAIARHMETKAEWRRRMEDLMTSTIHKITSFMENGQQVNLKILEALQDLKRAK